MLFHQYFSIFHQSADRNLNILTLSPKTISKEFCFFLLLITVSFLHSHTKLAYQLSAMSQLFGGHLIVCHGRTRPHTDMIKIILNF